MKRLRLWRDLAAIAAFLAIPLDTNLAVAQPSDTLTINGRFNMSLLWGSVGPDLAAIVARGETHTWTLTLHGLSYEHDYEDFSTDPYDVYVRYVTRVHATSFDFEFQGPDADELNAIVSSEWVTGGLPYEAVLELRQVILTDHDWGGLAEAGDWVLGITTLLPAQGIRFTSIPRSLEAPFSVDEDGYPILEPFVSVNAWALIGDNRPGNAGTIGEQGGNTVAVDEPLPLPPPLPPTLNIFDGSVREGNRGTTRLDLTVTLSRNIADTVTVKFATINGTAHAWWDYTATSGTLTFQPGQTSRTISVWIKGDRWREPNEKFSVRLSQPDGATINDGVATATILNDD